MTLASSMVAVSVVSSVAAMNNLEDETTEEGEEAEEMLVILELYILDGPLKELMIRMSERTWYIDEEMATKDRDGM